MLKFQFTQGFLLILIVFLGFTSCTSTKKYTYFTDLADTGQIKETTGTEFKSPLIEVDDILSITVQTTDPTVTSTLNLSPTGSTPTAQSVVSGYLVNKNGDVELPILGQIHVLHLTTYEASALIAEKAAVYYKLPTIQVRFANYKISVLGEVNKPGTYVLPNEKVSVIDAISLAGDLTVYGKRDNILIVRSINGKKEYERVNINSSKIFDSPFFYLRQNDIIYVEPNKAKISESNDAPTIRDATLIVSFLTLLAILFKK